MGAKNTSASRITLESAQKRIAELEEMVLQQFPEKHVEDAFPLEDLLDHYPGVLLCLDRKGRIMRYNRKFSQMLQRVRGTRPEIGCRFSDYIPEPYRRRMHEAEQMVMGSRHPEIDHYQEIPTLGHTPAVFRFSRIPLVNIMQQVYGLLIIGHEITTGQMGEVAKQPHLTSTPEGQKKNTQAKIDLRQLVNPEQIQLLQDAFAEISGVSLLLTGSDGMPITEMSCASNNCEYFEKSQLNLCHKCRDFRRQATDSKENELRCPIYAFGEHIEPIYLNQEHVGSWFMGHYRTEEMEAPDFLRLSRELKLDEQHLREIYQQTPAIDAREHERNCNLLRIITLQMEQYLQQGKDLVEAGCELSDLKMRFSKLEQITRAKTDFLAYMSHEIRTPLNSIIGSASLLKETIENADDQQLMDVIYSGSENLLNLINEVLDLSKMEAGKLHLDMAPLDLESLIDEVVNLHQFAAQSKAIVLQVEWLRHPNGKIVGDRLRLLQVINNLMNNAIKFTSEGTITIQGNCFYVPADKTVEVTLKIIDTGIGIEQSEQESVFKPFAQGNTELKHSGTGLGLTICRELLRLMQGSIQLESKPGRGSIFSINFSTSLAEEQETEVPAAKNTTEKLGKQHPLKLLVVDDSNSNRRMITALMKHLGYDPVALESGAAALEHLEKESADLVLLDIRMPGIDGFEVSRRLREKHAESSHTHRPLRIVALTADKMKVNEQDCTCAGIDRLIYKPITLPVLGQLLRQEAEALESAR
ncbi:MAG: response regulator [Opitutales bacterium]|nr:response regulator [Opitutales bacterium]